MSRTLVSFGFALALLGTFALEAAAQSSCSGWRQTCLSRCKQSGAASCPRCSEQMSNLPGDRLLDRGAGIRRGNALQFEEVLTAEADPGAR
jgi:hypothetical protein